MVWWPFATKPERADTSEVTDLHSGAPPLYSTSFVVIYSNWIATPILQQGVAEGAQKNRLTAALPRHKPPASNLPG